MTMTPKLHKPIGILGGTFDPIHFGHLRMALELRESMQLDRVHLTPCYEPVHRERPLAPAAERLAMIELAIKDANGLIADSREIRRKGPSYFIDTLYDFRAEFPATPLCLFIGMDAFVQFPTWHRGESILEECHIVIAHRPQYTLPETGEVANIIRDRIQDDISYFHKHLAGGIILKPITALEISASDIRKQFAMGGDPRYLLPDHVYQYIKQNHIYSKGQV